MAVLPFAVDMLMFLYFNFALRVAVLLWSFHLVRRARDWRLATFPVIVGFMLVGPATAALQGEAVPRSVAALSFAMTLLIGVTIVLVGRLISDLQASREATARREERLEEGEKRYQELFEKAPVPLVEMEVDSDAAGEEKNLQWIRGARLNHAAAELLGTRDVEELVPLLSGFSTDQLELGAEEFRRALRGSEPRQFELKIPTPDAEARQMLVQLSAAREGSRIRLLASGIDMTELKRVQVAFIQTQKLESMGVLAAGLAHDINNLMVAVLGNASLASEAVDSPEEVAELLEPIQAAAEQAGALCRQLLSYAGQGVSQPEAIDLNDLVEESVGVLRVSLPKGAKLKLELAGHLPTIRADRGQIHQLLLNLVTNAADALTPGAGEISVRTSAQPFAESDRLEAIGAWECEAESAVCLEVSDDGCGMAPDVQARIFDPFFTTKETGHGLGLSAALGIVRASAGALVLRSAPGEGTTFRVFFPASDTDPKPGAAADVAWSASGRALVADDEPAVLAFETSCLSRLGFEVVTAENGEEALRKYEAGKPFDLIVLDASMPRIGGVDVLRRIRQDDPAQPAIVSSGYLQDQIEDLVGAERTRFLQKPFRHDRLRREVEELLFESPRPAEG